jgi:hypothetical protein
MRKTAGCTCGDYKKIRYNDGSKYTTNTGTYRKLQISLEISCSLNVLLKKPIPYTPKSTKRMKVFGKNLQCWYKTVIGHQL